MISKPIVVVIVLLVLALADVASALGDNPSIPQAADTSTAGLDHLRTALKDAYVKGDIDAMMRYLHPDVVVVFPDGSILKGPQAFRNYYERMMTAPNPELCTMMSVFPTAT
jgi:N-dimethylarginine dimethylaminohydrolase